MNDAVLTRIVPETQAAKQFADLMELYQARESDLIEALTAKEHVHQELDALQSTLGVQVSLWQNKAHQLEQENAELQYALDLKSVNLFD